jgi:outer membrane protein insertion porin family
LRARRSACRRRPRRVRLAVRVAALLCCAAAALAQEELPEVPPADLPRVAVAPFRVHSARPLSGLARSLTDQLLARLEASGRVAVLDAASRYDALAPTGDAAVRALAAELFADYVVTGSITELAGRYSLDVRITPAEAGRESYTQVWTAAEEEVLGARIAQVADRVIEQAVGTLPALVTKVEITGAAGFERELLTKLNTRGGEPYDPVTVRADLAALRASPAVVSVTSSTERDDAGVLVRFEIVLADPSLSAPSLTGDEVIGRVDVRGNRRIEEGAIRARIASKAGGRYDPAQVGRDITEVHALGFFRNVSVYTETAEDGSRILVYEVEENPVVRQIAISGNDNIESDKIRDLLTLTTGSTLDYPLLYENRERIGALYRAEGYYLAEVVFEIEPLGEASVGIDFTVIENEKLKLRDIVFNGNEHFDDGELREEFQTKTWRFWSYATSWFDRSGTYSEPLFLQDLRGVERRYTDAGFLQVKIGQPEVVPDEDGLRIAVDLDEGRRFRVGELDVSGDSTIDIDSLREKLQLKTGDYFNRSHLTEDIGVLTEHYQDRGFYFAQVNPLSNLSAESEVVDVRFDVRKGPLYFIRRVNVSGNTVTIDPIVRREVPIVEGQLYSQRAVLLARRRIEGLGFFEEVDFKVEPTEESDQLDLEVGVVERPTGSFSFGAGFSSQDGLVVTGSLSQSNLFGRGYAANISADLGGRTQRFFINLSDPYFMGSTFSLGTTISNTSLRFDSFRQEQTGVAVVLGHSLSEDNRTRGFLRYSFDRRSLDDDSNVNAAAPILREILQDELTSSLVGLSFIQDTRDDRFAPTSGRRLGASLEGAGLGGFSRFLRLEAQGAFYLGAPRWLLDRSTFVFRTRGGWALPFNSISDYDTLPILDVSLSRISSEAQTLDQIDRDLKLPLTERYFLGGLGQFGLRGFDARSVGPRRSILQEVEPGLFTPLGYVLNPAGTEYVCAPANSPGFNGNNNGVCNSLSDKDVDDFDDLDETDVVGGNKFISTSFEYRFPISETVGLQGVFFVDMGNAFDEETHNLLDVTEWRYGTGGGIQWFSPFGPLAIVLGFPLDALSVEDSPVFEFSVGGVGF